MTEWYFYDYESDNEYLNCWGEMMNTYAILRKMLETELQCHRMTWGQFFILMRLDSAKSAPSISELVRLSIREPHTVSSLLTRMERSGYVRRIKPSNSEKLTRIEMTSKGKEFLRVVKPKILHQMQDLFSSLFSEEEAAGLISDLRQIRNNALIRLGMDPTWNPIHSEP